MRKRRNRVYRRIAVALTVALLAGQSHAFVLAEEDAGGAPQTEITGEADTSTPDNSNVADGGNADNGSGGNTGGTEQGGSNSGGDGQIPDDNGNQGDQQGDGDGQDKCICGTKCAADAVNIDCPVCAADYAACVGKADDAENDDLENGDTEDNDSENGGQDNPDGSAEGIADGQKCICETACTEENVNMDCPVCAVDYANCAKKAEEGENLSVNAALPEMAPASMADEEAGIDALADEGVEAYAVGDTFYYPENPAEGEQKLKYTVIKDDGNTREVEVAEQGRYIGSGNVKIPESVTKDSVTYRVTSIGEKAFQYSDSLEDITIPDSVTSIGESAFDECKRLKSITIPDGVTSIRKNTFVNCNNIKSITIPDSVTSIGESAFVNCYSLTSVKIPPNVTSIGGKAFSNCHSLTDVTIPDKVERIELAAFEACKGLTSITIPDSVTSINGAAFSGCESLTHITIPNKVEVIGRGVFSDCKSLNSITISDKVSSIRQMAFYVCLQLETMEVIVTSNEEVVPPKVESEDAFLASSTDKKIVFKAADGVTRETLEKAKKAYLEAGKKDDEPDDGKWYGWTIEEPTEVEDTHKVTITVQKDDIPWTTDCDRIFALTKDGGTTLVTNLDAVEAGEYTIYDVTDSGNKLDTGVTVTVANTDASNNTPVEYYTVAFCYFDDDGNEQTYGDDTVWKPQTVLKDAGRVAEPATNPTKVNYTFDKWVTAPDGDDAFAFAATPITAAGKKIHAKWTENPVTTYYTVTFYDGTTPYGADTPHRPQSVADGQKADRPDDPEKAGWEFAGWKTKTADGGSTDYDFDTPVTGDISIYASWVEKTVVDSLRIQATATEGGTIAPKGEIIVSKGGERTFTITPNEGNKIKAVTVDDEDVTADLKETRARAQTGARYYTFTNIVKDHTIHAEFERDGSSSGGGGGDNPNPGGDNPGGGSGGGGGGDNPDSGNDDDNKKPGSGGGNSDGGDNGGGNTNSGGGNNGGGTNPDGSGNNAGNIQTAAGTETSSAQAGNGVIAASAGGNTASDGSKAAGGSTSGVAGTAANGKEPKTGDASYLEVYATLAMIAGLTYLLLYVLEESRGMNEREKEAFVAAFIRWGKKGGAFRKCCAVAAIFCLLAYYHIVGKNVGENALRKKHLGQAF